jgi:hypothetical protein
LSKLMRNFYRGTKWPKIWAASVIFQKKWPK